MMRDSVKALAFGAGLLALLTFLLIRSHDPDVAASEAMLAALQRYELHDAQLTRDVLQARAGLLRNYDALADDRRLMSAALAEVTQTLSRLSPVLHASLQGPVQALGEAGAGKLQAVERFKSRNSQLRNSLMYMTFVALPSALGGQHRLASPDSGRLAYALLRDIQMPDAEEQKELGSLLERISSTPAIGADMSTLVDHGKLVARLAPESDALLRQILGLPPDDTQAPPPPLSLHEWLLVTATIPLSEGERTLMPAKNLARRTGLDLARELALLQAEVRDHLQQAEAAAERFRLALYGVAVVLLAFAALQFQRLRAGALALRHTNAELKVEMAERTRATEALRSSEERLRAVSDSAKEAIVSIGADGTIVSWNAGAQQVFGYADAQILGQPFSNLWPVERRADHQKALGFFFRSDNLRLGTETAEFQGLHKDGSTLPLEVSLSTWSTAQGRFLTAIMRDVSERKRLEADAARDQLQLIQAKQMADLGQQVAMVAHEIGNRSGPLSSESKGAHQQCVDLLGLIDSIGEDLDDTMIGHSPLRTVRKTLPDRMLGIRQSAEHIDRFVQDLKHAYYPPEPQAPRPFDLNEAVERALRLQTYQIEKRTSHFRSSLAPGLPPAIGDIHRFEQVVVNLLSNALNALPDGDKSRAVCVTTGFDTSRQRVVLLVEDQGVGIPKENLARLGQPFFTTRQSKGGSGLGLSITMSLLKDMGGIVRFESEPGRGTRAIVEIGCQIGHPDAAVG